jgi:hypothetical protein
MNRAGAAALGLVRSFLSCLLQQSLEMDGMIGVPSMFGEEMVRPFLAPSISCEAGARELYQGCSFLNHRVPFLILEEGAICGRAFLMWSVTGHCLL